MNKIYCQKCGHANEYRSLPTKFCGKCGQNMSVLLTDDSDTVDPSVANRSRSQDSSKGPSVKFQQRKRDRGRSGEELDSSYDSDIEDIDIDSLDLGSVFVENSEDSKAQSSAFSLKIGIPVDEPEA